MDVLRGTAIPAFLVLLLTSVGWLLDRSITRLGSISFIEYQTRTEEAGGGRRFWVDIQNASLSGTIDKLTVLIACDNGDDCLAPATTSGTKQNFLIQRLYEVAPKDSGGLEESASAVQIDISLIAGSRVTLGVTTSSANVTPKLTFYPDDKSEAQYSISRGVSYSSFIARNYTAILLIALLVVFAVCIAYVVILAIARPKTKDTANGNPTDFVRVDLHVDDLRRPHGGR